MVRTQLKIEAVKKVYDNKVSVLKDINLEIAEKEFLVLVGPSGCGKSTLLRIIAGLEPVTEGRIYIAGRDVTELPPAARDIAMVFQDYALYPHMTVRENLAFGLKMRGTNKETIEQEVDRASKILDINHLLDRKPSQLSGGQRQRVAIGRAIVRRAALFLFDEPLSNLDAKLRSILGGSQECPPVLARALHHEFEERCAPRRCASLGCLPGIGCRIVAEPAGGKQGPRPGLRLLGHFAPPERVAR